MQNKAMKKILGMISLGAVIATSTSVAISCASLKTEKIMLITDGGSIQDKSFNQQGMEAVEEIIKRKHTDKDYMKPSTSNSSDLMSAYITAASGGTQTIFAPGFYHEEAIKKFNENNPGLAKQVTFIAADVAINDGNKINTAGIVFKVYQAAFQAGYLAAKYLVEIKKDTDPKIGIFAGGNFHGATDFLTGVVYGVKYYNEKVRHTSKPAVKFVAKAKSSDLNAQSDNRKWASNTGEMVNSGFSIEKDANKATTNSIIEMFKSREADIVLASAGPMVKLVIDQINADSNWKPKIIGVDTDMSKLYPGAKNLFLTSILKNVKDSMVRVYNHIYKKANKLQDNKLKDINGVGENSIGTLENELVGIAKNSFEQADNTTQVEDLYKAITSGVEKNEVLTKAQAMPTDAWDNTPGNKQTIHTETPKYAIDEFLTMVA